LGVAAVACLAIGLIGQDSSDVAQLGSIQTHVENMRTTWGEKVDPKPKKPAPAAKHSAVETI